MGYQPNTADIVANILQGSANVESVLRNNTTLNQLSPATGSYSMGTNRMNFQAPGIVSTDSASLSQLVGGQRAYVVSGCVWTAVSPGSALTASMSAGTVMIAGILLTVAAVTARSFTASSDTYVDLQDNGDGTANVTYTVVTNSSLSPALPNSGTMLNTVRVAIIAAGSTNIAAAANIVQGVTTAPSPGTTLGASTVASGSNGNTIVTTPLNVASGTSFSTGGGWCQVVHSTQTYTIQYTGVSGNTLTGVTLVCGTAAGTVSTGDAVNQVWGVSQGSAGPVGVTDMLGNMIYPTRPYPSMIAYASFSNAFTSTSTSQIPIPGLIAPFIIPAGPARNILVTVAGTYFASSAAAGTTILAGATIGNAMSPTITMSPTVQDKVSVASDGVNLALIAMAAPPQAAGSYTIQMNAQQGAAGTLTFGLLYGTTSMMVELI